MRRGVQGMYYSFRKIENICAVQIRLANFLLSAWVIPSLAYSLLTLLWRRWLIPALLAGISPYLENVFFIKFDIFPNGLEVSSLVNRKLLGCLNIDLSIIGKHLLMAPAG
jgi:hypothetical protein